ncbi:MAG: hypothetical protein FWH14_04090 [Oscillospiraceae bacterium]|nr:hypothetical protein [Oscillospiraceae bacterium]
MKLSNKIIISVLLAAVLTAGIVFALPKMRESESTGESTGIDYLKEGYLVAHGFGGLDGVTYTNSLEAFHENYQKGHKLFEVDFQFTSDDVLVTLHDRPEPIGTFEEETQNVPYTLMSFEMICDLMMDYDDFYIITDTKYNHNLDMQRRSFDYMLSAINERDPKLADRIVVQSYTQAMVRFMLENYDFKSHIYTLYASPDTGEEVIEFVRETGISAVCMPIGRATPEFISALNQLGVFTFVHTINDTEFIEGLLQMGVFGIYTDFVTYSDLEIDRRDRYPEFAGGKYGEHE